MAQLTIQIEKILQEELKKANETLEKVKKELAEEGLKELKATSPTGSRKRKKYKKSWYIKSVGKSLVLANKEYRLTHLLEFGHQIIRNGRLVGSARALPHIGKVEKKIIDNAIEKYRKIWKD